MKRDDGTLRGWVNREGLYAAGDVLSFEDFTRLEQEGLAPDTSGEVPDDNGDDDPANILVNNNGGAGATSGFTQSETSILAFGNTVLIGFNDSGSSAGGASKFTGFARSTNGGVSFTDGGTLPTHLSGDAGDPVLARHDASGRVYYSTLAFSGNGIIQVFRSDNGGTSWQSPINGTPGGSGFMDKQWMAVDNFTGPGNGNVYLLVRDFGPSQSIRLWRSTDAGATFTGGQVLFSGGQGAYVAVGPDHSVYAARWTTGALQIRRSTDQGVTFGATNTIATVDPAGTNGDLGLVGQRNGESFSTAFRSNKFPHMAVNPVSGHLYVVYNDNPAGSDKSDVFFRMSTNNGVTWSAATRVNTDATTNDNWQPTIAVTPSGSKLGIFWYDRREDTTTADGDTVNNQIKYYGRIGTITGSTVTFAPDFAVSDVAFKPEFGRDSLVNPTYMGDYDSAAATNDAFHVVWADNRSDLAGGGTRKDPSVRYKKIAVSAGPQVTSISPAGVVDPGLASVTLTFDRDLNPASLDAADFILTLPGGTVPIAAVTPLTPTQVRLDFAPQFTLGSYALVVGPNIADTLGNLMDQDGDGIAGEALQDQFSSTLTIRGPRITLVTPNGSVPGPVTSARYTFSRAMDPLSFSPADFAVSGPGGPLDVTAVTPVSASNTQFDVFFTATAVGLYTLTAFPDLLDTFGIALDQDNDFVPGEPGQDRLVTTFGISAPRINSHAPTGTQSLPVGSVTLNFNKPIDAATFTADDVASFTGPGGANLLAAISGVAQVTPTQFRVDFDAQSVAGNYNLVVGPDIRDLAGNQLDQDNDLVVGEIPADRYTATFAISAPRVSFGSTVLVGDGLATGVQFNFTKPIDPATFTLDDIAGFSGPGGSNLISAITGVTPVTGTVFRVDFAPQGLAGSYSLVIGPDIRDLAGNPLDQDNDLILGEIPQDRFTHTFSIAAPRVSFSTTVGTTDGPVTGVIFNFSKAMDPATFTSADVASFTGHGGINVAPAVTGVTQLSPTQFRLDFTEQGPPGIFTLVIGPDIRDLIGNPLDQDFDLILGEIPQDQFTHTFSINAPRITSVTPATGTTLVGPLAAIKVNFSKPMDVASFSAFDDLVFTGPSGIDQRSQVTGVTVVNATQWRIDLAPVNFNGAYTLILGPNILDLVGNALDQDFDNITGEPIQDRFTVGFNLNQYGPDNWGYKATTFAFENLDLQPGQPGVFVILDNLDDAFASVNLDTNKFNFYGQTYTGAGQLFVSTNGLVTFGAGDASIFNNDLSFAPAVPSIATFWDDLKTNQTAADQVLGKFEDLTGDLVPDRLIIEWNDVMDWTTFQNRTGATFQLILSLNTGLQVSSFVMNYVDTVFGNPFTDNGGSATVGIKDQGTSNPTRLLVNQFGNNPFIGSGKALQWTAGNSISGQKWNDTDTDGVKDAGEPPLAGWTVYLDANANQTLDPGEPTRVTDADGNYAFNNLLPGPYVVREVTQPGWVQTAPPELFLQLIPNSGFETNSLLPEWTSLGVAGVVGTTGDIVAPEGSRQGHATNSTGSVTDAVLAAFIGQPATGLDALGNGNAIEGSAIKRTVSGSAGQTLSFRWNFLTNELTTPTWPFKDFAFVSLSGPGGTGVFTTLANTASGLVSTSFQSGFSNMTGYRTFSFVLPADGEYTLAIGVCDVLSPNLDSRVLVDDLQLTGGDVSFGRAHLMSFPQAKGAATGKDFGNYYPPVADAGGPYTVAEGSTVPVSAAASVDLDNGVALYEWDFDYDGSTFTTDFASSSPDAEFSAAGLDGDSSRTIAVRVTDAGGLTDLATADVTITNVAPTLVLNPVLAIDENGVATLTGTISDPGTLDTFTLTVNWGDPLSPGDDETYTFAASAAGTQTFALTHQYLDDNPSGSPSDSYTITADVADDDGAADSAAEAVAIQNVAPVITSLTNSSPDGGGAGEGQSVTIAAAFTDVGTLDTHAAIIDWGDGTSSAGVISFSAGIGSVSASHAYAAGGVFTITLVLTDDDQGTATLTTTAVIAGAGVNGGILYVVGTSDNDQVQVSKSGSQLKVATDFFSVGSERFYAAAGIARIVVLTFGGSDQIQITGDINLPATVEAGAGHDQIQSGSGDDTLLGGDGNDQIQAGGGLNFVDGGAGNDNLSGGSGGNIIVGGDGSDNIQGGSGRDLLIGGRGADNIQGNSSDDILIGGWTSYDADRAGLDAIYAEWSSARTYAERIANIRTASGPLLDGTNLKLEKQTSVFDDGDADNLNGASGTDWYFYLLGEDLANRNGGEEAN
jgi:hypothetical protein